MIVLDTHAWLWWMTGNGSLTAAAAAAIDVADTIGVSAVSVMELATAVRRRRVTLDREVTAWVRQASDRPRVGVIPITREIAVRAGDLEGLHGDPADRIIVATALMTHARVVTRDARIREFKGVRCIW